MAVRVRVVPPPPCHHHYQPQPLPPAQGETSIGTIGTMRVVESLLSEADA